MTSLPSVKAVKSCGRDSRHCYLVINFKDTSRTSIISTADRTGYESDPVQRLTVNGREFILVGTAHVSKESAALVQRVIESENPERVCVELDKQRFEALTEKKRWDHLDIKQVIREKQLSTLLVNFLLSAYQRKLGVQLGVLPGTELLEAIRVAKALGIPVSLCDRDVRVTLRRVWASTPIFKKALLLSAVLGSLLDRREISEEEIQELLKGDVLSELMKELGEAMPSLKEVLIHERDLFLSQKILDADGMKVVAVVGAGHLAGITKALTRGQPVDLRSLNEMPVPSNGWKWLGWAIPITILAAVAYIGWARGAEAAGDNAMYWFMLNAIPTAIGAIFAWAHPLTILAGFLAAPFTSLTPVIGAAYVTAFVQAYLCPPVVQEFENISEDITVLKKWWQNKLLKVFLAFLLPGIGSMLGSILGGLRIFRNLFGVLTPPS